jgi:hypothetical protein
VVWALSRLAFCPNSLFLDATVAALERLRNCLQDDDIK